MRTRLVMAVFAALVLIGTFVSASGAKAAAGRVENQNCTTLGETAMADNHGAILACVLKSPNAGVFDCKPAGGGCKWSSMSGGGDGPAGSLCGLAAYGINTASMMNCGSGEVSAICYGSILVTNIPCKGHVIVSPNGSQSCPSGYSLVSSVTGGDPGGTYGNSIVTCVKNPY